MDSITQQEELARELLGTVEHYAMRFRRSGNGDAAWRHAPGAWSVREILGHLIDSAANNHQRFVRAQLTDECRFPRYMQDDWVRVQHYDETDWQELVELWRLLNRHLAHIVRHLPESALGSPCAVGADNAMTLLELIGEYIVHLQHHLAQIEERIEAEENV